MFAATENTLRLAGIKQLTVNGNSVAVLLNWQSSAPAGKELHVDNIDVYTVEQGQITAVKVYSADQAQEDRIWG